MTSPAPIESLKEESLVTSAHTSGEERDSRFSELRGVQWRINLGILPSSASIDDLRRVTADARRRYAGFRRQLLVDPHFLKDGNNSPDHVIDNPLSQNPDSMWGQFFRNAELEKMVDQDLSRLYPEHGSYFQTAACQGILRRILLLWCLRHSEYGYRQGMHELLAPLLYVLHVDMERLSEVRKVYEHHFNDKFDDISFPESDLVCNYKSLKLATDIEDMNSSQGEAAQASILDELDPEIESIILLTDSYGAEGELGILLSERFMEHDAYCMFDALMGGAHGAVAMAEYFSPAPSIHSLAGLPPVIEASSALYHLLSVVDPSLHSHLVELGVEPQYFALRWLRVLFGREFVLDDILIIWDEIFSSGNGKSSLTSEGVESSLGLLQSPRGAFISAMAVAMLLHLRSSLLATETATSCLQRLLNFPENVDVKKLIEKAKSLQSLALDTGIHLPAPATKGSFDRSKSTTVRGHSLSSGSVSPRTPLNLVPESYWEEKWRVLHKDEPQPGTTGKCASSGKKRLSERVKLKLGRADSCPAPMKSKSVKKDSRSAVRRNLIEDLSRVLGAEEDLETEGCAEGDSQKDPLYEGTSTHNTISKEFGSVPAETSQRVHPISEESSPGVSASSSTLSIRVNDHEIDSDRSSVGSNSSVIENNVEPDSEEPSVEVHNNPYEEVHDDRSSLVSDAMSGTSEKSECSADASGKQLGGTKDRRLLLGKFQWLWKFGKGAGEGTSEKGGHSEAPSVCNNQNNATASSTVDECVPSGVTVDKNVIGSLKNLGQSMLENIQVLESVLQQERNQQVGSAENSSKNHLVGKGQVTAVAALKELRKISHILSEM